VEKMLDATTTGVIQKEVLKALSDLEREKSQQMIFDIWCEAGAFTEWTNRQVLASIPRQSRLQV
jgi:hypothetical protein